MSTARVVEGRRARAVLSSEGSATEVTYYLSDTSPRFIELGEHFLGREMKYVYDVDLCV